MEITTLDRLICCTAGHVANLKTTAVCIQYADSNQDADARRFQAAPISDGLLNATAATGLVPASFVEQTSINEAQEGSDHHLIQMCNHCL